MTALVLAIALAQALPAPAAASSTCHKIAQIIGHDDYITLYVDDRRSKGDGVWVYAENHDKAGFQRGGAFLGIPDPCQDNRPDTAILFIP